MTTKLEQAARALLAHWDTPAWRYLKPTGDLMADLREALGENNGKRTMDGNSEYNVAGGNDDCSCIGNDQEPVIDLSKLRHEDKCRYWDDERFCDCGADSHELLKWYRKNAAPVQQAEQEPVAWVDSNDLDDLCEHLSFVTVSGKQTSVFNTPLFLQSQNVEYEHVPIDYSWCIEPKPVNGLLSTKQTVSQEYQDHLVNQSFDWSAMAAKHQFMEGYRIGLAEMREACAKLCETDELCCKCGDECAAAIRAIKFEGDTGFRPVSEMIAEHKQDPKKGAAIKRAEMRKAEQEPVAETIKNNIFKAWGVK